MPTAQTANAATALLLKATILAARWAGMARRRTLVSMVNRFGDKDRTEITFLRDRVEQLELQIAILRKHVGKHARSPRYTLAERLHVLWFLEYFQIPRRRISDYFGIARSTLYRWLHRIDDACPAPPAAHNRTPSEIIALVWEIAQANSHWGRVRIANQLAVLRVFLAASTVRNILARPRPRGAPSSCEPAANPQPQSGPPIRAFYPNHVWSIDCTTVLRWGLWPTQIFVLDKRSKRCWGT